MAGIMRHAGGARSGLTIWLLQRASAVWLALASPVLLWLFAQASSFETWRALFVPLPVKLGVLLTVVALLLHAWIGLREVLMDYVHPLLLRMALLLAFGVGVLLCLAWTVHILWSLV